jgi:glycosyltransferase involved in cell wall biosynthesis
VSPQALARDGHPQRVLHLLSSLEIGGKERVVLELATRARAQGHDHRLVLFDREPKAAADLDPGDVPWSFVRRDGGFDLRFLRGLAAEIRGSRPDGIHAHNDTALFYAALAARLARMGRARPFVLGTFHTRPGHDTRAGRTATRWATRLVDGVTCVSDELARLLVELGWTRPAEVVWNGVDPDRFRPDGSDGGWRERLNLAPGSLLVGHVGRHDPLKRQVDLLDAGRQLRSAGLALELVFAGDGPGRAALEREASRERWVHLVPRVDEVAELLRALDVFVLCSTHEAAPRALMEALSCGRACVATAVGGIPTLVSGKDGAAALLVPAGRPAELASAIARLAADPALRRELGLRGRERMSAFSLERTSQGYEAAYRRAAARQPR